MGVRDFINKQPMLGWGVAALAAVVAAITIFRGLGGSETAELTQQVTIRCRETGKEWKMSRGAMEKQLMLRPFPVNPEEGLINPDTGKPTGFPIDDWKVAVDRINATRAPLAEKSKPAGKLPPTKAGSGR